MAKDRPPIEESLAHLKLLDAHEVAEVVGCSYRRARELIESLPDHVRIGSMVRLPERALARFIERGGDRKTKSSEIVLRMVEPRRRRSAKR